jgi:hypothetical protein
MDDLVEYLRSWSHQPHVALVEGRFETTLGPMFFRLDVEPYLRAVPLPLAECLARERIEELVREEDVFIPVAILSLCLLGCEPFIDLDPPKIRVVPKNTKVPHPRSRLYRCRDRDRLFHNLAWALFIYDRALDDGGWPDFSNERSQTLPGLGTFAAFLEQLHRHGRALVHPLIRPRSTPALLRSVRQVQMAMTLTQEVDYRHAFGGMPQTSAMTQQLVQDMAESFEAYGPPAFPQAAMHATLEAILKPLGVCNQRGERVTAAGIKGMLRRQHRG